MNVPICKNQNSTNTSLFIVKKTPNKLIKYLFMPEHIKYLFMLEHIIQFSMLLLSNILYYKFISA